METSMNRRNFLKAAVASGAVLVAGGALAGCSSDDSVAVAGETLAGYAPVEFTDETDVLIIGTGIAGLSAAMDPVEAGFKTTLVDKLAVFGGESFIACGVMNASCTVLHDAVGLGGNLEETWARFEPKYVDNPEVNDVAFKKAVFLAQTEWVNRVYQDYGAEFQPLEDYMNTGAPTFTMLPKHGIGDMTSVLTPLKNGLEAKGAQFKLNLCAKHFIIDPDGTVCGVRFTDVEKNRNVDIKAKKIIVATGGFSCNQEMVSMFIPSQQRLAPLTVNSMGEGHVMCQEIGGVWDHMDTIANTMSDLAQVTVWGYFGPNVQVTPQGRRFINEDQSHDSPIACAEGEFGYWWTIFDNQLINGSQKWNVEMNMKNSADRLVGPCDTIEDLAVAMDMSVENLVATFDRYNELVDAGEDTDFKKKLFLQKLEAPFYAMKHFPFRYKTHGGLKITTDSQLVDAKGDPIANVYMCGSTTPDTGSDLAPNAGSGLVTGKAVVASLQA